MVPNSASLLEECELVCRIVRKGPKPDSASNQALAVAADCTQQHDDFCEAQKAARCCEAYASITCSDPVKGTLLGLGTSSVQEWAAARLSRPPATCCDMPVTPVLGPPEACSATSSMMSVVYDEQQPSQTGEELPQASPGTHATDQAADPPKAFAASLFFARVPPTVPYEAILELFEQFGKVASLNLFRPWATAKTSKGCGIVLYDNIVSSVAAMTALHNKYHWTGGETTMVVEWANPTRQRKENPDAKGVFEAKHKTVATAGSRSRFRNQVMKHVMALGLQEACTAPPHLIKPPSGVSGMGGRSLAAINRGVASMLPQLPVPSSVAGAAGGSWGWALQGEQGPAAQQAYTNALAAAAAAGAAAPYPSDLASAAAMNRAACGGTCTPAAAAGAASRSYLVPNMSGFMEPTGASYIGHSGVATSTPALAAAPLGYSYTDLGAAGTHGSPINTMSYLSASSPTFGGGAQQASPGLTLALLQQQPGHGLSRLGPGSCCHSGAGPPGSLEGACSSTGCYALMGLPQNSFGGLVQQQLQVPGQPVSYLSASAGLMADASMLATAAAVLAPQPALAGGQECQTPLAYSSQAKAQFGLLAGGSCHTIPTAFAAAGSRNQSMAAAGAAEQHHWLRLQARPLGGSTSSLPNLAAAAACGTPVLGEAEYFNSGGNLIMAHGASTGSITPVAGPAYPQHPALGAAVLCNAAVEQSPAASTSGGWW